VDAGLARSPPFSWSSAVEEKAGCGSAAGSGALLGLNLGGGLGPQSDAGLDLGLRMGEDEWVLERSEKGFLLSLLHLVLPLMSDP